MTAGETARLRAEVAALTEQVARMTAAQLEYERVMKARLREARRRGNRLEAAVRDAVRHYVPEAPLAVLLDALNHKEGAK